MREVTIFEANDGRRFATKEECLRHEQEHFLRMAEQIRDFCSNHEKDSCEGCIFYIKGNVCAINDIPEDWDLNK